MAFIITHDYLAAPDEPAGTNLNAVGIIGPSTATEDEIERLGKGNGHAFKMFDDDDELYYRGRFIGDKTSEEAFEPLECFGLPNAGCTKIEYYNSDSKKWELL